MEGFDLQDAVGRDVGGVPLLAKEGSLCLLQMGLDPFSELFPDDLHALGCAGLRLLLLGGLALCRFFLFWFLLLHRGGVFRGSARPGFFGSRCCLCRGGRGARVFLLFVELIQDLILEDESEQSDDAHPEHQEDDGAQARTPALQHPVAQGGSPPGFPPTGCPVPGDHARLQWGGYRWRYRCRDRWRCLRWSSSLFVLAGHDGIERFIKLLGRLEAFFRISLKGLHHHLGEPGNLANGRL